jgi:hypothetical protein
MCSRNSCVSAMQRPHPRIELVVERRQRRSTVRPCCGASTPE